MTDERDDDDDLLSGYFAAARRAAPLPDEDFLHRIVALGRAEMPAMAPALPQTPAARPATTPGLLAQIGGWWTASGLAGALALGLVMGMSGTVDLTGTGLYGTVEMLPGLDTPFADSDTAGGE